MGAASFQIPSLSYLPTLGRSYLEYFTNSLNR
jgi:hypothetical protein